MGRCSRRALPGIERCPYWSVLTAIGDGGRFISGMSDQDAADCVWALAERIRQSKLPGVMVLNLHPQNVAETRAMHLDAMDIIRSGFVAWNLRQCLEWFASRDLGTLHQSEQPSAGALSGIWRSATRFWPRVGKYGLLTE